MLRKIFKDFQYLTDPSLWIPERAFKILLRQACDLPDSNRYRELYLDDRAELDGGQGPLNCDVVGEFVRLIGGGGSLHLAGQRSYQPVLHSLTQGRNTPRLILVVNFLWKRGPARQICLQGKSTECKANK